MSTKLGSRSSRADRRRMEKLARKVEKRPGAREAAKAMLNAVVRTYHDVTRRVAFERHADGRLSLEDISKTGPAFCDVAFEKAGPMLRVAGIDSPRALHEHCEGVIRAALVTALRERLRATRDCPVEEAGRIQEALRAFRSAGAPSSTADPDEHQAKAWRFALDLLMPHVIESARFKTSATAVAARVVDERPIEFRGPMRDIDAHGPMAEQTLIDTMPWIAPEDRVGAPRRPDKDIGQVISPLNRDLSRAIRNQEWPEAERPRFVNGVQVGGRVHFPVGGDDGGPVPDHVLEATGNVSTTAPEETLETREADDRVGIILAAANLTDRERDIFLSRVYREEPVADIARRLGISTGRVSQIFGEASAKLRSIAMPDKD